MRGNAFEGAAREFVPLVLDARQPVRPLVARMLQELGHQTSSVTRLQNRAHEELHRDTQSHSLYGPLHDTLDVQTGDGAPTTIDYINPFALLAEAASRSLGFFRLLQHCVGEAPDGVLRFILYHDGVTPGNNLRPDLGRSFVSFLWSFLELPQWMRNRGRRRWFTLCYVQKRTMDTAGITIPL